MVPPCYGNFDKQRSRRPSTWRGSLAKRLSHTCWLGPFLWGLIIFASTPFPCATDSISQYHQVRASRLIRSHSLNLLGLSLLCRNPMWPTSWRKYSCPDLDYGTSVHFTSPSGWQSLAQASVPNSIPPGASYGGKSILSPTNYFTFTQNDFDFTLAIPVLDPFM